MGQTRSEEELIQNIARNQSIHASSYLLLDKYPYLEEPRPWLGKALGTRVSLQVSNLGAEPPMLGAAVDNESFVFILHFMMSVFKKN